MAVTAPSAFLQSLSSLLWKYCNTWSHYCQYLGALKQSFHCYHGEATVFPHVYTVTMQLFTLQRRFQADSSKFVGSSWRGYCWLCHYY